MSAIQQVPALGKDSLTAIALLVLTTAIFGAGNVAHKAVLAEIDTWSSLALRAIMAMVILLPWAIAEWRRLAGRRRMFFAMIIQPAGGFGAAIILQSLGAGLTTATSLGFLINLSAIFTPLICIVLGHCRACVSLAVACLLSVMGTALIGNGVPGTIGLGELFCIGAALGYSVWIISLQRISLQFQCPALITFLQWVAPAVAGLALTENSLADISALPSVTFVELAFLGVVASGLAYLAAAFAAARLSPVTTALIYSAEAIFGSLAATWWLRESLTTIGYAGALLIFLGIVIVSAPGLMRESVGRSG